MKKTFGLLFALVLVLSLSLCGAEKSTFTTSYYTLPLPDGWVIDMEDLESEDDYEYLGSFYAPEEVGLVIYASLKYFEDLKDFSLWNAGEADLQDYIDSLLEDLEDYDVESLGTVMAGNIPFVVVRGTDEDGDFLYADTMTNGYAIEFQAFVLDSDPDSEKQYPVTDEEIELFRTILTAFQPAG